MLLYYVYQAKALLTDDYGKDLVSVEALIRKHEELERDISAIDTKLEVCGCCVGTHVHTGKGCNYNIGKLSLSYSLSLLT